MWGGDGSAGISGKEGRVLSFEESNSLFLFEMWDLHHVEVDGEIHERKEEGSSWLV